MMKKDFENKLTDLGSLKANLGGNRFRTKKGLGQNFLVNEVIAQAIVEGAEVGPEDTVLEIGPGVGNLTRYLLARAKQVLAVELDRTAIPLLKKNTGDFDNLTIIEGDVLKIDVGALLEGHHRIKVVANLPYYITSPILMMLMEGGLPLESITVMVQKEVGERILAPPSCKDYGALTLAVGYYAIAQPVIDVPRENFHPVPGVDSIVLKLVLRDAADHLDPKTQKEFFGLVKAGFGQRRKNLLNALSVLFDGDKAAVGGFLATAGIDGGRRAETLTIDEFKELAIIKNKGAM